MNNNLNGTSGHSPAPAVNYGIMEKTRICKGTGLRLPVSDFYFDKSNNRYESYCKAYKTSLIKKRRKSSDVNELKQTIYNLRNQLKQAREEIKKLKDGI
jgi:hypothetical protein